MKDCVESTAQWLSTHCARRRSLQDDIRGTTEEEIKDAQASDLEVLVLSLPYPGFLPWRILDHLDEFTWLRKVRWSLHISSDAAEFCRSGRGFLILVVGFILLFSFSKINSLGLDYFCK